MRIWTRLLITVGLLATALLTLGTTASTASLSDYTPVFGKGEHTRWNGDVDDFGVTHHYYASPTDYGWYTALWTVADYSYIVAVCYYYEETDTARMALRFGLNNHVPFPEDGATLTVTIGEHEPFEGDFWRRSNEHGLVEIRLRGFDRTRASDTLTIGLGPFEFKHDVRGLFDLHVAQNIIWCDDREEPTQ